MLLSINSLFHALVDMVAGTSPRYLIKIDTYTSNYTRSAAFNNIKRYIYGGIYM